MADDESVEWPVEVIPNEDFLFMRVHVQFVDGNNVRPGVFRDRGSGMSTDWSKYAAPAETLARAKKPEDNGVVRMGVRAVRGVPGQAVEHRPVPDNRAHTEVIGDKTADPEVRLKFSRIVEWSIRVPRPGNPVGHA